MNSKKHIEMIVGDGRAREAKHWLRWLQRVPPVRNKFVRWHGNLDPLLSNETASVAFLANAAANAGYHALTEYVTFKRHATRGRPLRRGRCDLWVADNSSELCWAFEMKQHFASAAIRQTTFDGLLEKAYKDAKSVHDSEATKRVGCLIMAPCEAALRHPDHQKRFDDLCAPADYAFRIGGGFSAVWLVFKVVA